MRGPSLHRWLLTGMLSARHQGSAGNRGVEAIEGRETHLAHGGAAGVTGTLDDDQFGARPGSSEVPRGDRRPADVTPAVDEDTRNASQLAGVTDQRAVVKETIVAEVVRADPHERHPLVVQLVAVHPRGAVALPGNQRVFPGQPDRKSV